MTKPILSCSSILLATASLAAAQSAQKVTIVTRAGETIEGSFGGATPESVAVSVAGQTINVPVENIEYVSFVGEISTKSSDLELTPLDAALDAFKKLQAATEIGLLRDQYSEKLQETLPTVNEYLKGAGDEWVDAQRAMAFAVRYYQAVLDTEKWEKAADYWGYARGAVAFAEEFVREVPPTHREEPTEITIELGDTVRGRLGTGDRIMDESLDKSSAGAFNDVYRFRIDQPPKKIVISVKCYGSVMAHVTLIDPTGKKIEGDAGWYDGVTTKKKLNMNGEYVIWVGGRSPGRVGAYEMHLTTE